MILVTGASGFIGGALARALAEAGHDVRGLVRSHEASRQLPGGVEPARGDIRDSHAVRAATAGCETIFHLAGSYRGAAAELRSVHVDGTRTLLDATDARVVYVSSTSVYGWGRPWPADDRTPPAPVSDYGRAKLAAEQLVHGRDGWAVVRPTIVYGRGDSIGMIPRAARLLHRGWRWFPGDGRNRLHLTHIDDVVNALLRLVHSGQGTYVVAGAAPATIRDILATVASAVGAAPPRFVGATEWWRGAGRATDAVWRAARLPGEAPLSAHNVDVLVQDRAFDATRARTELGWEPTVPLAGGLHTTLAAPATAGDAAPGPPWRTYFDDPDEGLGTVYERFVIGDVIDEALRLTGSDSIVHAPLFGMTGVAGLDVVLQARRGVRVGLVDVDAERLGAVQSLWKRLEIPVETHLVGRDPSTWPDTLGQRYELAFSFAAMWWFEDPWAVLAAQARWADKGVLVVCMNRSVFLRLRERLWHRGMFTRLNDDANNVTAIAAAAARHGLALRAEGYVDMPPFPDTSVPLARVVRARAGALRAEATVDARTWRWSILPYLTGEAPDLDLRMRRLAFLERNAPTWLAAHLAHHRWLLLTPHGPEAASP